MIKVFKKPKKQPTSFVLKPEHVEFLRWVANENATRLGKNVNVSHVVRALIQRAMDDDRELKKVWDDEDLK
jgi:hypothetical protein